MTKIELIRILNLFNDTDEILIENPRIENDLFTVDSVERLEFPSEMFDSEGNKVNFDTKYLVLRAPDLEGEKRDVDNKH